MNEGLVIALATIGLGLSCFSLGYKTAEAEAESEPTYELVQTVDGNAYVVDFNLSKSDCITQIRDNPKAILGCVKE